MPKAPYFSQYESPNIVIVPTECCYGPPKKPKLESNVLPQHPDSRVKNCMKPDSLKIPNLAVTNQTSENSVTNNHGIKQSMQTSLQNEVPKSIARDVNKNVSAVDNNLNKTTKQASTSWASNYLLSIGQLNKKSIKLNLAQNRNKGLTLRKDTSAYCTAGMNSKEETNKTSSIINDKERRTAITMNYKIPLKTSAHLTTKFDSKKSKMPSEKTETIVNQISTDTKHTKPLIKCDSKNITHRDKITDPEHLTLRNSDGKSNIENLKMRPEFISPESNRKATKLTSHTKPLIKCNSKNITHRDKITDTEHLTLRNSDSKSNIENLKMRAEFSSPESNRKATKLTSHTKPLIKCDSKNITHRDKITDSEHLTLENSDSKSNIENLKMRPEFSSPESNRKPTKLTSSSRRNSEWKNEEKHEKDINKTKTKDLYFIKHLESKKKDKTNPESTMFANTCKPAKIKDSEKNKSRHMNSASKSSAAHSKNERSTKPLKISNFFLNADTEKNLGARSKSSKISRGNEKEDKYYVKNRKGSTKNKKDHSYSSTKKSLDFGIKKKKSKACTLDTEKKSKSKSYNIKQSTTFRSTIKDGASDDHRSSSKDSIKSVVQLTDNSLHHKHKIDENFDLRTRLSPKGLNHYFTKIHNAFSRYSIPNENRENLIITVRNENDDDNERMDLKNVHEPSLTVQNKNADDKERMDLKNVHEPSLIVRNKNDDNERMGLKNVHEHEPSLTVRNKNADDNERMDLKNVHETSPDKDSKGISVRKEYKKIKLVINLICQQPSSHKPEKNENCGSTNEDLSFLDDFNVDEIVETLKHCENESVAAKHNVEIDIEVHAGLDKTNPVSLDIRENKINCSDPETVGTIVRSRREYSGNKCTANLPQNLSHQATFVKIEKFTNYDTPVQGTIQETKSKIDILKDQSSSNKIIQQLPTVNNVQLQETVNLKVMEAKLIKDSTKTANSKHEVSSHEIPVINNIKKEPGIEANDKSDKISNKDVATIGGKNNHSSVLETIQIKSEPQSNLMLSNTLDDFDLREKLRESDSRVEAVDNLPEITNVNINCLHEDDDNASDVTLVLSPPHFGDFSLIDLTNEVDIENVSEIENYVKKEKETTGKTAEKLLDDLSLIDSSNELSIEKVSFSEIENYVKKEIETTGNTAEKLLDDPSLNDSSNELSIEKVSISEVENCVKNKIETTGKTAENLLDDLSLIDSSNELSIEKVSVSEIENYVKKEIETTGNTAENLLDGLSLIDSSNELSIEKVSEIENYVKKEIKTIENTAENLLDGLSLIDSSIELSIEKVSVSEIENYVKKEIQTTQNTAEKLLDDPSLNDSSNELSIEKVSISEVENCVKNKIETTGKTAEKLLDNLSLIDSSNKLIEKVSNVESHLDTEMTDIDSTQNIPPDSVSKPTETTEHMKSFVSNTPNASDASKTSESGAFSNTIKNEGSSDLKKCGKRKNEDLQNESKSKIVKVEDCVSNTSFVSVCDKKEQKDEQQQSKTSQSEIMCEPDKLLAQNLEQRMLSYLCEQYTITSVIHKGTFSKIFHCQNSYGKDFAVKVINNESNRYNLGILKEKMLTKIQQEIPEANYNCIHIYNGFSLTGFWCFLMEYYPVNLMQAISKNKKRPFHINVVKNLARQLVAAVTVLRNYKIVHADICPRHILLNHSQSKLKLCGFDGSNYIACVKLAPNIGTVSYRAPEVILGYSAGYSIDVWSTALVIYKMATGKNLFPGFFNNDILYKQMCTLGNIPYDMVQKSLYKYSHYSGLAFMRKVGAHQKKIVFIKEFFKSNRLRSTIFNQHKRYICNPSVLIKLKDLCSLLEGMLVLHPNHRFDRENLNFVVIASLSGVKP